ncbi:MAG: hypothetical protein ACXVGB_00155 [Mycobacteriaceae bacterium]
MSPRFFEENDREALETLLPHLLVRMEEKHRSVLIAIFYDLCSDCEGAGEVLSTDIARAGEYINCPGCGGAGTKGLGEIAREQGVEPSTIMRRRDAALAELRRQFLGGDDG